MIIDNIINGNSITVHCIDIIHAINVIVGKMLIIDDIRCINDTICDVNGIIDDIIDAIYEI